MIESSIDVKAKFATPRHQVVWMSKITDRVSVSHMAFVCKCSERTIRSWRSGQTMMPFRCLEILAKEAMLPTPKVSKIGRYEHTKRAGVLGSATVMKKYGKVPVDEKARKESWRRWFDDGGKEEMSNRFLKETLLPKKSEELAEFIGIMLGDGGMTSFQVTVTLHLVDDAEYGVFVQSCMEKLFGVVPSMYYREDVNTVCIVFARKKAVAYLCSLGLVTGNKVKQQIRIPAWVLKNKKYSLACLRGLMDTDGSVYVHSYKVGKKEYKYKKLCFSSASAGLRKDVQYILRRFGSRASCSGTNVRIDSIDDVKRYMEVIGTHNPKHLKRYAK